MSLRDQIHFIQFLAGENQETFDRLRDLFKNEDVDNNKLLKSFLSTSGDLDFGENILSIAENQDSELVNQIFEAYAKIVDSVEYIEDSYKKEFGDDVETSQEDIIAVRNKLLLEGKNILKDWGQKEKIEDKKEIEDVIEKLKSIDFNLKIKGNIYKNRKESAKKENCDINCFLKSLTLGLNNVDALKISSEDRKEMEKIYKENYFGNDEFQKLLIDKFKGRFSEQKDVEFYFLEDKKEDSGSFNFGGFVSYEKIKENVVEMASVNLSDEYKSYGMGEDMILGTIAKFQDDYVIEADALVGSGILEKYKEIGFEIVDESNQKINIGDEKLEIVRIRLDKRKQNSKN